MWTSRKAALGLAIAGLTLSGIPAAAQTSTIPDATEIVRRADQKTRGLSSKSEITVNIVRPTYTREMSLISWSLGDDYFMILVTAPTRDEGTTFLKREKEIWNSTSSSGPCIEAMSKFISSRANFDFSSI